jgi:hypothetical protein
MAGTVNLREKQPDVSTSSRHPLALQEQRLGFDPAIVTNPSVHEFHQHWLTLKGERDFPAKSDFDPVAVPRLLPGILLMRVHEEPLDFEYRIIGEEVVARLGNLKGRRVREAALLNTASDAYKNYVAVIEARRPQFLEGIATVAYRERPLRVSRVHCPLSADGERIDHIISYAAFM